MLSTSLKIAFRGFIRNRFFTTFNLLSLVIGLFVAFVAFSYIKWEYSYDEFHENSENVYRLARTYRSQDYSVIGFKTWNEATAAEQQVLISGLKDIPGVETAAQFITSENLEFMEWNGKRVQEKNFLTTNTAQDFVSVFTWKPLAGSLSDFGTNYNRLILTESNANKFYDQHKGNFESLIGEVVQIGDNSYQVSAVIEDVPQNSHFDFSVAISDTRIPYWGSRIYLGLAENSSYKDIEGQINAAMSNINPNVTSDPLYKEHFLQPIEDIHLKSNILYEMKTPGNYTFLILIGGFALFIGIITLFNYANFTLAIKSKQGKSIGIKKAMGAKNKSVALQFFVEGILLALLAIPFLSLLIFLVMPAFNNLMNVDLNVSVLDDPIAIFLLLGLAILFGTLSSIAPSVVLSSKNALTLFKENLKDNRFEHFSVRKYLVISQFAILIIIISISYFVNSQMNFIEGKDLGFNKEGILYAYTSEEKLNAFQEKLRQIPEIKNVGNGSTLGIETFNQGTYKLQDVDAVFDDANQLYLDYEALKAYGIKSTIDFENETTRTTIINRTAAEKFAKVKNVAPQELIGTVVITEPEYVSEDGQVGFPFTIGGIFEDINLFSLKEEVTPYFIMLSPNVRMGGTSIIAFEPDKAAVVMDKIKTVYGEINESFPLEMNFLSENLAGLYEQEEQAVNLVFYLNILAVILASMGIIGITVFLVLARRKEIGIRKVLGASDVHIIKTTIKEYIFFIGVAFLVGWPIAYYGSRRWLSGFAYRIDIEQYIFLIVGLLVFLGTAFLVGLVALNAARKSPVKSLRTE
ncbi:ABC transporter permease [Maribacter aestuarii]|uniref:ABC transporter permease n=1 Tax=Maribacter aestuarii TaxID=1130723 RepID=UPI0025A63246|nr:ABC transporter permease [Maribacter aestuarii]